MMYEFCEETVHDMQRERFSHLAVSFFLHFATMHKPKACIQNTECSISVQREGLACVYGQSYCEGTSATCNWGKVPDLTSEASPQPWSVNLHRQDKVCIVHIQLPCYCWYWMICSGKLIVPIKPRMFVSFIVLLFIHMIV